MILQKLFISFLLSLVSFYSFAEGEALAKQPYQQYYQFVFIGIIIVVIYFFMWRPQSKRNKEHKMLMNSLAPGLEVMTAAGMVGIISKVEGEFVFVNLSKDFEVKFQKGAITRVLPKHSVAKEETK